MALSIKGSEIRSGTDSGYRKFSSHADAIRECRSIAEHGAKSGSSASVSPTSGRVIFYDFEDAKDYVEIVDAKGAKAAMAAGSDDSAEVLRILSMTDAQAIKAYGPEKVKAKRVSEPFSDSGVSYPAGSWVILRDDRSSLSLEDKEFNASYKAVK